MTRIASDPKVAKLAKDLGLDWHGDCLVAIREYALAQIEAIKISSPITIDNLDVLRFMVADKFRVRLDFLCEDGDVDRLAAEYSGFHSLLRQRLSHEFLGGSTEGITLERESWDPRFFRYLAVVDARGERASRAYFTAWHELTHMLVFPAQLPFPGFRRTPAANEREKDPIESVVDHITGRIAFYPSFFRPALERAIEDHGGLNFDALGAARDSAAPSASLFATAMGSIQVVETPLLFVTAGMALKAEEHRFSRGAQCAFGFATATIEEKLRLTTMVPNNSATESPLSIQRNMRVPSKSVIARASASPVDVALGADEEQSWWETSRGGSLESLSIRVEALRRGRYVYGMISLPRG